MTLKWSFGGSFFKVYMRLITLIIIITILKQNVGMFLTDLEKKVNSSHFRMDYVTKLSHFISQYGYFAGNST